MREGTAPSSCTGASDLSSWKADRASDGDAIEARDRWPRPAFDDMPIECDLVNDGRGARED